MWAAFTINSYGTMRVMRALDTVNISIADLYTGKKKIKLSK
jgi:hypothetical protein